MQSGVSFGTGHVECFITGDRVDRGGRLDMNGSYVLDREGRPVPIKGMQ